MPRSPGQHRWQDTSNEVEPSAATLIRRQADRTAVYPLGEVEQRPRGWSTSAKNERTLRRDCALDRRVVLGDHRGYRQTERPLDLSPAVMQPSAVPTDDEGEPIWVDS